MKNPFEYGGVVGGSAFCNRKKELSDLVRAMENSEKLFLYSERRLGKTSLIHYAQSKLPKDKYASAYADLWATDGEVSFVTATAKAITESMGRSAEQMLDTAKRLFTHLVPSVTVDSEGKPKVTFGVSSERARDPEMLIGKLGRDPEVKYSQQGTTIALFSVTTTERWKDKGGKLQEHTEWFAVKAFSRLAVIAGEHLHKGSRIYLEGRKRTEPWDHKQTGAKHYRDLVYADRIEFLDSKANGNGHGDPAGSVSDEPVVTDQEMPF